MLNLTTDRQEASRGLFATAELLVSPYYNLSEWWLSEWCVSEWCLPPIITCKYQFKNTFFHFKHGVRA